VGRTAGTPGQLVHYRYGAFPRTHDDAVLWGAGHVIEDASGRPVPIAAGTPSSGRGTGRSISSERRGELWRTRPAPHRWPLARVSDSFAVSGVERFHLAVDIQASKRCVLKQAAATQGVAGDARDARRAFGTRQLILDALPDDDRLPSVWRWSASTTISISRSAIWVDDLAELVHAQVRGGSSYATTESSKGIRLAKSSISFTRHGYPPRRQVDEPHRATTGRLALCDFDMLHVRPVMGVPFARAVRLLLTAATRRAQTNSHR